MRIQYQNPIKTQQNYYKPSFKSFFRTVKNNHGGMLYKNNTCFFRTDLEWKPLGEFLANKYQNSGKINITSFGCSIGEEAYSLAILLQELHPQLAENAFPIIGIDNDKEILERTKENLFTLKIEELAFLEKYIEKDFDKYLVLDSMESFWNERFQEKQFLIQLTEDLRSKVVFKEGNILTQVNKLKDKNQILFCRNIWPYLKFRERVQLATELSEKLNKTSTLIIGNYDWACNTPDLLENFGFRQIENLDNVFVKKRNYPKEYYKTYVLPYLYKETKKG